MKSILKRTIVLMIAVAVLVVPMAVSAENYDENATPASISLGTKSYAASTAYDYTVYEFEPTEKAEYTFTASDKKLGIVSNHGMWVTVTPGDTTITETSITWECTGVGQTIWIAVKTDKAASVSIKVEKKDSQKVEIPWTIYQNVHTPTDFTFTGNVDDLEYVDVEDGIDDSPSRDEDGFYHFGSDDGPILYVDLDDSMMNLVDAVGYGKLAYIGYDGDNIVTKIDFTNAFMEYSAKADKNTKLYPLTEDLIQIYKLVGQNNNWYGDDGYLEISDADCWMFACYYDATLLKEEDTDNKDDNISGDNNGNNDNNDNNSNENDNNSNENDNNTDNTVNNGTEDNKTDGNNDTSVKSPVTGDHSAPFTAVLVLSEAVLAAIIVFAKKKATF